MRFRNVVHGPFGSAGPGVTRPLAASLALCVTATLTIGSMGCTGSADGLSTERATAESTALSAAQDTAWSNAFARFGDSLAADVEEDDVGSIVAGVAVRGEVVWARGFGWKDRDRQIPADANTIYRVGSISKTFTAALLALLVQSGTVALDQPVRDHLPAVESFVDPPADMAPITYRQLASHTAGLIREPGLEGAASGPISSWEDKILASIPTTSFLGSPGAQYSYSNIGFGVLGLALSRAAGAPFMELVEQRIFQPLGMTSSTFVIGPALQERLATGYSNSRNGSVNAEGPAREHDGRGYKVPNGGIYSTVGDLAKFMAALSDGDDNRLLSEEVRAEMLRVQTPEDPAEGYGLGLSINVLEDGTRLIGHGGSVAGYTAHMLFEPRSGISVVLLRNYNSGATNLSRAASTLLTELLEARG